MLKKQELMIHAWHDDMLKIKLDDYILSFDDGLYSQVLGIRKIVDIYPDINIHFYVTTGFINIDNCPRTFNESDIAQDLAINMEMYGDFVSYDDLIELSKLKQVTIGFHGHRHLRPSLFKRNNSLNDYIYHMRKDIDSMVEVALKFKDLQLIKNGAPILYCTPYNEKDDLVIALIRKGFNTFFSEPLIVTGPERLDIFDFDECPPALERYSKFINEKQQKIISAMRVPPKYFTELSIL